MQNLIAFELRPAAFQTFKTVIARAFGFALDIACPSLPAFRAEMSVRFLFLRLTRHRILKSPETPRAEKRIEAPRR